MSLATNAPASAAAQPEGASEERDHARLREAASRMATSLVRYTTARSRHSPRAASPVVVDQIVTDEAAYRLRGELLSPAADTPVVLVAIERRPNTYPSYRELRVAFGLTRAEARVATMLAERKSNREIARALGVTEYTARRHTERLLLKLGVTRRTAVRRELLRCLEGGGIRRGHHSRSAAYASRGDHPSEPSGPRSESGTAVTVPEASTAQKSARNPRRGRPKGRTVRHFSSKESVVVLLAHERDRQVVREALSGEVQIQFATGPRDVHPPWPSGAPIAVLVELHEQRERGLERALAILQREAPNVPRWAYVGLDCSSVRVAVRLAARDLIVDVITTGDDLGARLRALLKSALIWSESEALWKLWDEWAGPGTREIVGACIAASAGTATARDVERQLNRSPRTLRRELTDHGLPSLARLLALCRLLRAMYRLDHRDVKVKTVASELGYKYSYALPHQLRWFTGLSIAKLPAGRRFATLAALVRSELPAMSARAQGGANHATPSGKGRG